MQVDASTTTTKKEATMATKDAIVLSAPTNSDETINNTSFVSSLHEISQETTFEEKEKTVFNTDEPVAVRITTYGTDCFGCNNNAGFGGSASGVSLSFDAVKQSNGEWKDGITYDGYYIVAANGSIPIGSVVEISNHGFSGKGLVEGQTFYAMVLDRGAMTLNHLDLFVGSEANSGISINRSYTPTMKIVRLGY